LPEQKSIETGVDKLVALINRKKRIPLNDAAKELGVSIPVVQEWANFLEDEGLISIEDMLRKTYLVERKLSKGEVEKKTKEYVGKKDAFIAKVETAISSLHKESEGLDRVKEEFDKLKDAIGGDIDLVKEELAELKHYEELKKSMDKDILQQRLDYQTMLDGVRKKVMEEKKQYETYLDSIGGDKGKIEEATVELSFLQKKAETIQKRVDSLQTIMHDLQGQMDAQQKIINASLQALESKVRESEQIRVEMKGKIDKELAPIMAKIKSSEEKIMAVQNAVLQKIMAKHKEIDAYKLKSKEAADKLRIFFERRGNIQGMIDSLQKERTAIQKELEGMAERARKFDLSMKSSDTKKFVKELQEGLKNVEKKRLGLKGQLEKLTNLLNQK